MSEQKDEIFGKLPSLCQQHLFEFFRILKLLLDLSCRLTDFDHLDPPPKRIPQQVGNTQSLSEGRRRNTSFKKYLEKMEGNVGVGVSVRVNIISHV